MSKFKKLINPKTDNYYKLKEYVLGAELDWTYQFKSTPTNMEGDDIIRQWNGKEWCEFIDDRYENLPYLSHIVVMRPQEFYVVKDCFAFSPLYCDYMIPTIESKSSYDLVQPFLKDLLMRNHENKLFEFKIPLRINFNTNFPHGNKPSIPHVDHDFPHNNLIVYFTDTGGDTIIGGDNFTPKEDDIISFNSDWFHCFKAPKNGRRVVMVMTYI